MNLLIFPLMDFKFVYRIHHDGHLCCQSTNALLTDYRLIAIRFCHWTLKSCIDGLVQVTSCITHPKLHRKFQMIGQTIFDLQVWLVTNVIAGCWNSNHIILVVSMVTSCCGDQPQSRLSRTESVCMMFGTVSSKVVIPGYFWLWCCEHNP